MKLRHLLLLSALTAACDRPSSPPAVTVIVHAPFGESVAGLDFGDAKPSAVRRSPSRVELDFEAHALPGRVFLSAPGLCKTELALSGEKPGAAVSVRPRAWLTASGGELAQLGFDTSFTVQVTPGCREAVAGKLEWSVVDGELELHSEKNGFIVRGKTSKLDIAPLPWGIVPISPRTRGAATLRATWRGSGTERHLDVHLAAAARATGVPSIALGQRVLLGGEGWHVSERPPRGHADISLASGIATFRPDARGRWLLADGNGRELSISAGLYSETPLDCGRSDCHIAEARAAIDSKMTTVFARGINGALPGYDPGCALACHTAGEPGLADGGFSDVLAQLGRTSKLGVHPGAFDELPRPLRRLAGVGCVTCHGPAAIPEPAASWAILRADVCATCHDAPPRYSHVVAWRRSRMARADRDDAARTTPACRRCHTTAGFLSALGVRPQRGETPPDEPMGIACAACHAPHAAHQATALLRAVPPEETMSLPLSAAPSELCLACHADSAEVPSSSAGTLVFAAPAGAPSPHAKVPRGCLGCHGGADSRGPARGARHDFRARTDVCVACHGKPPKEPAGETIAARAARLAKRFAPQLDGARPAHAQTSELPRALRVVLEDPAAWAHNGPWARQLLDQVEKERR